MGGLAEKVSSKSEMAILALSDIVLFATLLANAGAVLDFKIPARLTSGAGKESTVGKAVEMIKHLRFFRIFIAAWNIFILLCMVLFFGHT